MIYQKLNNDTFSVELTTTLSRLLDSRFDGSKFFLTLPCKHDAENAYVHHIHFLLGYLNDYQFTVSSV